MELIMSSSSGPWFSKSDIQSISAVTVFERVLVRYDDKNLLCEYIEHIDVELELNFAPVVFAKLRPKASSERWLDTLYRRYPDNNTARARTRMLGLKATMVS